MSGPASNLEKTLRTNLLLNRAFVGVLLIWGVLPLALVALLHAPEKPNSVRTPPGLRTLNLLWSAAAIPATVFFRSRLARPYEQRIARGVWPQQQIRWPGRWWWRSVPAKPSYAVSPTEEVLRWWEVYTGVLLFGMLPVFGAANFHFLIYAIDQDLLDLATGVCFYALLVPMWPRRVSFDSWVHARREAVQRLRHGGIA